MIGGTQSVATDLTAFNVLYDKGYTAQALQSAPSVDKIMHSALFMLGLHLGFNSSAMVGEIPLCKAGVRSNIPTFSLDVIFSRHDNIVAD